jgi:poly(hydroxyalkanoate) granule-associated protein
MTKRLKKSSGAAKTASSMASGFASNIASSIASGMASGAVGQISNQISEKVASMAANLSEQPSAKQVMESAQQIWLAGLGAFSKAQAEGKKAFEALVSQGETLEKHTRHVAEATIETAKEQATKTFGLATGKFDKLEQVFEDRVHKSLSRLGVLTSKDVEALSGQVAELSDAVRALLSHEKKSPARVAAKAPAKTTAKPVVKKTAVKKVAKQVAKRVVKTAAKPVAKKVTKVAKVVKKIARKTK